MYISIVSLIIMLIFAAGVPIAGWVSSHRSSTVETVSHEETLFQWTAKKLEIQKTVDAMLQEELESGGYTFESPLVVLDPYGESPLTALVLFETEEPSKIEITIPGEDEDTGAVYTFDEISTKHIIPVYGLYPNTLNEITLKQLSKDGSIVSEHTVEIQTEPLPEWLDNYTILTQYYQGDYENGLNYMQNPGRIAFDKNGEMRWFYSDNGVELAGSYRYGDFHFIVTKSKGQALDGDVIFFEIDRLGKIYCAYYGAYGAHHDITSMPNGNLLITGSYGDTIEDFIYEINTQTGETVNTLDLKNVLQRTRFGSMWDWCHNNSIAWDERDNTIIISSNVQCTIAKLSWPDGEIKWLLSNPLEYMPRLQPYLLEPVDDTVEYSYNQHHATILPDYDNDLNTVDILLFDNGWTRFDRDKELQRAIAAHEIVAPENYSRMVHYRINEKDMTVEQIWQYGKERGEELYSLARGSAQLLSNGNLLGYFDKQNDATQVDVAISGNLVEVDREGNLVWDAEIFPKDERGLFHGYRAFRYPIYLSDEKEHDIYTEAQNLIPQEILDRNQ